MKKKNKTKIIIISPQIHRCVTRMKNLKRSSTSASSAAPRSAIPIPKRSSASSAAPIQKRKRSLTSTSTSSAAAAFVATHKTQSSSLALADVDALFRSLAALSASTLSSAWDARDALAKTTTVRARRKAAMLLDAQHTALVRFFEDKSKVEAMRLCYLRANCCPAQCAHDLSHFVVVHCVWGDVQLGRRMLDNVVRSNAGGDAIIASLITAAQLEERPLRAVHVARMRSLAVSINARSPRVCVVAFAELTKALCLFAPAQLSESPGVARVVATLKALLTSTRLCWHLGGGVKVNASELVAKYVHDFATSSAESAGVALVGVRYLLPRLLSAPLLLKEIQRFIASSSAPIRAAALHALGGKIAILEDVAHGSNDDWGKEEDDDDDDDDDDDGDDDDGDDDDDDFEKDPTNNAEDVRAVGRASNELAAFIQGATKIASLASARDPVAAVRKAAVSLLATLITAHETAVACGEGGEERAAGVEASASAASAGSTDGSAASAVVAPQASELRSRGIALRVFDSSVAVRRAAMKSIKSIGWPTLVERISRNGIADLFVRFASECCARDESAREDTAVDAAAEAAAEETALLDLTLTDMLEAWQDGARGAAAADSSSGGGGALGDTSAALVARGAVAAMLRKETKRSELLSSHWLRRNTKAVARLMREGREEAKEEEEEGEEEAAAAAVQTAW